MLFFGTRTGISLVELVNTTCGVNDFLFSGKKRMTFRANVYFHNVTVLGRSAHKFIAARALEFGWVIIRMDFVFHSGYYTHIYGFCQQLLRP